MTDKEFCELDSQFYGEEISNIKQIALRTFNGEELKEYVEHCIKLSKLSQHDVIKSVCEHEFVIIKDGYMYKNIYKRCEKCGQTVL